MNTFTYLGIDPEATGARIRKLRTEKGFTVEELSEIFDVSQQAIYKWQRGLALPTLDNMMVLSDLFKVKVEDIVVRYTSEDNMAS